MIIAPNYGFIYIKIGQTAYQNLVEHSSHQKMSSLLVDLSDSPWTLPLPDRVRRRFKDNLYPLPAVPGWA